MEEFQFATELHRENTVRRVEALQQFQCKGKETVSMSVDQPVSEIHPSDIIQPPCCMACYYLCGRVTHRF